MLAFIVSATSFVLGMVLIHCDTPFSDQIICIAVLTSAATSSFALSYAIYHSFESPAKRKKGRNLKFKR